MSKLFTVLILLMFSAGANAQNADEYSILQNLYGTGKRQVLENYLVIPEESVIKFWALYEKYEEKRKEIGRKRIANIEQYASNLLLKDNKKAIDIAKQSIKLNNEFSRLLEKAVTGFEGVIPPETIAKFVHIEHYLDNLIKLQIAEKLTPVDSPIPASIKSGSDF